MLENRKAYESRLDAQLAQWDADLDVLKAKARRAEVDAMVNYDKAIDALQRKHEEASVHLAKLKEASDETWECVKAGTEKTWHELKAMFHGSATKS
jgi:predicted methyltransferase MtxX (methanogen marker protein 4)